MGRKGATALGLRTGFLEIVIIELRALLVLAGAPLLFLILILSAAAVVVILILISCPFLRKSSGGFETKHNSN